MNRKRINKRRLLVAFLIVVPVLFVLFLRFSVAPVVQELAKARVDNRASYIINEAVEALLRDEAVNYENIILLDYLAVVKKNRGKGTGSRILHGLKQCYEGKGIFVEIDSPYENAPDRILRLRRKNFYMASGFQPAGVMASVFGVHMELLCFKCSMDFAAYHAFYRDNYSPWAAEHILEARYPE